MGRSGGEGRGLPETREGKLRGRKSAPGRAAGGPPGRQRSRGRGSRAVLLRLPLPPPGARTPGAPLPPGPRPPSSSASRGRPRPGSRGSGPGGGRGGRGPGGALRPPHTCAPAPARRTPRAFTSPRRRKRNQLRRGGPAAPPAPPPRPPPARPYLPARGSPAPGPRAGGSEAGGGRRAAGYPAPDMAPGSARSRRAAGGGTGGRGAAPGSSARPAFSVAPPHPHPGRDPAAPARRLQRDPWRPGGPPARRRRAPVPPRGLVTCGPGAWPWAPGGPGCADPATPLLPGLGHTAFPAGPGHKLSVPFSEKNEGFGKRKRRVVELGVAGRTPLLCRLPRRAGGRSSHGRRAGSLSQKEEAPWGHCEQASTGLVAQGREGGGNARTVRRPREDWEHEVRGWPSNA